MKIFRRLALGLALGAIALTSTAARAEELGNGSIRVTLSESAAAQIKVRYENLEGLLEKSLAPEETLEFRSYSVLQPQKILIPVVNQFTAYKTGGQLVLQFAGDPMSSAVFLSFPQEGAQEQLQQPSSLEIEISEPGKAEAVDENQAPLFEISGDPVAIASFPGMALHFAVTQDPPQPTENPSPGPGDPLPPADPQAPAAPFPLGSASSGGCALNAAAGGDLAWPAAWIACALLATARRLRKI